MNQINQTNKTNQMNKTDQINERDEIASSRGEVGIMPQDMESDPYSPEKCVAKNAVQVFFNTSYQLLARRSACVLCGWFLSLDFQRNRP